MLSIRAAEAVHNGMGTGIFHRAYGDKAGQALQAVKAEARRLERLLSCYCKGSDISRINRLAGIRPEKISQETFDVLSCAAQVQPLCQGAFDITIGPLVDVWDYKHAKDIPEEASIQRVLPLVNGTDLLLSKSSGTAMLRNKGQAIDLGGVGKGYASDRFMDVFRKCGIRSAFTNIGGNVSALGMKPDGSPWRVGIRHPRQENALLGAVVVADESVVTSGDYERYFIDPKGKRRHHILNPATGYPAESGLISVTVMAKSAMTADALSTAIFVAGMQKGLRLLSSFPDAQAVIADTNLAVYVTPGLMDRFSPAFGIQANLLY